MWCSTSRPIARRSTCFAASPRRWCSRTRGTTTCSITSKSICWPAVGSLQLSSPQRVAVAAGPGLGDSVAVLLRSDRRPRSLHRRAGVADDVRRRHAPSIDRKAEMLACHASQRDWLRAHHGMDEYIEAMKRHGAMRGETMRRGLRRGLRAASRPRVSALYRFAGRHELLFRRLS